MARLRGIRISLTISPQVDEALCELLRGGLHGHLFLQRAERNPLRRF